MEAKLNGLIKLLDEALKLAEERLIEKQAASSQWQGGMERIISGLRYLRSQAIDVQIAPSEGYRTLGAVHLVTEYDSWDSLLAKKAREIEEYYRRNF